jgi:hypothetical protein
MKKILRFGFLVTLAEKRALERLAEVNEESQASFLRRLIRQASDPQSRLNSAHSTLEPTSAEGVTDSESISAEEVI